MNAKVAFVTSGAKGIGFAIVKSLVVAGWDVFFTYGQSAEEAALLSAFATRHGRRARGMQANLFSQRSVLVSVQTCLAEFGPVDAFIHNFGPFRYQRTPLSEYTDNLWNDMMCGNLNCFVWIYRQVVDSMQQRGFGRIVTLGFDGAASAVGWQYRSAYAAAKAALASLTRSVAKELRGCNITANMVCPGDIRGQRKMMMFDESSEDNGLVPVVGEDIGRFIAFLCEDGSRHISGTVTTLNGGVDTPIDSL